MNSIFDLDQIKNKLKNFDHSENEETNRVETTLKQSRINEINNSIDNSIVYKIEVASTNSNLSPVIDSRFASIKIVNNLVERSSGKENRFGRKDERFVTNCPNSGGRYDDKQRSLDAPAVDSAGSRNHSTSCHDCESTSETSG